MTQWEYLTRILDTEIDKEESEKLQRRFNVKKMPRFAAENMIPELDSLGQAGWELVHMEPVPKVGGKGDLLFGAGPRWSHSYFCVFKRPKVIAAPPPQVPPATPPATPPTDPTA